MWYFANNTNKWTRRDRNINKNVSNLVLRGLWDGADVADFHSTSAFKHKKLKKKKNEGSRCDLLHVLLWKTEALHDECGFMWCSVSHVFMKHLREEIPDVTHVYISWMASSEIWLIESLLLWTFGSQILSQTDCNVDQQQESSSNNLLFKVKSKSSSGVFWAPSHQSAVHQSLSWIT